MRVGKTAAIGGLLSGIGLAALFGMQGRPAAGQSGYYSQPFMIDVPAPKLVGSEKDWLNTGGKRLAFQKGRVYVVEYWTFG
jgi:hypothetical protein